MLSKLERRLNARGVVLLFVTAILVALGIGGFAAPAFANECTPDATTGCVRGVINTSAGDPAAGVDVTLSGGGEEQTVTTSSDGTWAFSVSEPGEYTVSVDIDTLPSGQYFKSLDERTVDVQLNNTAAALFPLTDNEDEATGGEAPVESENGEAAPTESAAVDFSWPRFWQQFANGIRMGLLIALASVGLSLIFGTTGLSNFAHGELVTMGGLMGAVFMGLTGNLFFAAVLAVAVMGLFGWTQDKFMWRPLRKRRLSLMQLMIVSIGLSISMQYVFQFFFGAGIVRIDSRTPDSVTMFGVTLTVQSYVAMGISLAAIILVSFGLLFTRFGRATRAIADNPALAQASGINVDRVITVVWTVGGALAGLSGVFLGLVFNGLNWFTGGQLLLLFFAAVTLGGLGTAFGAFVGSMVIGMMVEISNIWLPGDLKYGTALLVMILVLLVRPQGIFGRKERIG